MDIKSRFIQAKEFTKNNKKNLVIFAEFFLIAVIFFGLGVLYDENALKNNSQISITEPALESQDYASSTVASAVQKKDGARIGNIKDVLAQAGLPAHAGNFVASKNGKSYYLATCRNNIKEENKIYFQTKEDADKAGFKPARNCFK